MSDKNIKLNKTATAKDKCLLCEQVFVGDVFKPCQKCTSEYLQKGVLLVEVIGGTSEPTGRLMVIRDIAFTQVFNQEIPKEHVIKVEVGILQKMEEHINSVKN